MKSTKFWVILISILLLVSAAASLFVLQFNGGGTVAVIYQDGVLVKKIHLETITTPYHFTVEAPNGGNNTISVEPNRISVSEASCPDHVCVQTGWISDGAIPIVCLPNKLVIQIESASNSATDITVQ